MYTKHISVLRFRLQALVGCAVILLLISTGCRVGPDYKKPDVNVPVEFVSTLPNVEAGVSGDLSMWWKNLDDPVLDLLVDKVMQGNLDLKVAGDRIAQAQAVRSIISSSDKPAIDVEGSAMRESYSLNSLFGPFLPITS